jgi:hypothetical protein
MAFNISKQELVHAQLALLAAILLQVFAVFVSKETSFGPQYLLIATELGLAVLLATTLGARSLHKKSVQKITAGSLLGVISLGNIVSLILVLHSLIIAHAEISGAQLLVSALAIFLTNIIVYALWYWEIDSPGLTSARWSKHDKDFQFTQQDMPREFPNWQPQFIDYLYLSVTSHRLIPGR